MTLIALDFIVCPCEKWPCFEGFKLIMTTSRTLHLPFEVEEDLVDVWGRLLLASHASIEVVIGEEAWLAGVHTRADSRHVADKFLFA